MTTMQGGQDVCLFSRERMELSGIDEVESFTDEIITVSSVLGMIGIEGKNLKIESFSADSGELKITGYIDSLYYYAANDKSDERHGIFAKLFR